MSKRVLVVEDQEDNRQILRDLLRSADFEVIEAADGEAGLSAAAMHRPDLILMDVQFQFWTATRQPGASRPTRCFAISLSLSSPLTHWVAMPRKPVLRGATHTSQSLTAHANCSPRFVNIYRSKGPRVNSMERREFVRLLGSAAVFWPLGARAQRLERLRQIGFLLGLEKNDPEGQARITAFRQGLETLGWTEGGNIRIDARFAGGDSERIRFHVAELVTSKPALIVAHSAPVIAALKQATSTIPIVFVVVNDPVGQSLVASLAQPGGNITGFTFVDFELLGKWLELLREITPNVVRAGLMFNPDVAPYFHVYLSEFRAATARALGLSVSPSLLARAEEVIE
jgi:hypothetical protein